MENELQNKVRSLNEHQSKVDKMEEELVEIARRQKQIFKAEVYMRIWNTNLHPAQKKEKKCAYIMDFR